MMSCLMMSLRDTRGRKITKSRKNGIIQTKTSSLTTKTREKITRMMIASSLVKMTDF